MDQEIYRLFLALVLTGLVLFAWQYYRVSFCGKSSDPVEVSQQTEVTETQKATIRRDRIYSLRRPMVYTHSPDS